VPSKSSGQQSIAQIKSTGNDRKARLLIIRFSSFGDIVQAMGIPDSFLKTFPDSQVDWLVRKDFAGLLTAHPLLGQVIAFDRSLGFGALLTLAWQLAGRYTHVYDAHNNVRSFLVRAIFRLHSLVTWRGARTITRPKNRIRRWLLFRLRINLLPQPFRGSESFQTPLRKWLPLSDCLPLNGQKFFPSVSIKGLPSAVRSSLDQLPRPLIALAPSAAWEMKRWPIAHWKTLIELMPEAGFILLGGPEDTFLKELESAAPGRTLNLAGKLTLAESAATLQVAALTIANDTGLLHVADQLEKPTIALIGPTAFGYPSHASSRTLEIELSCKPCSKDGRGQCVNSVYQRCLIELAPARVVATARELLGAQERLP
jgi:ADP-heptose:LPS heptosyltransferase